jgi:hypothetical protein
MPLMQTGPFRCRLLARASTRLASSSPMTRMFKRLVVVGSGSQAVRLKWERWMPEVHRGLVAQVGA